MCEPSRYFNSRPCNLPQSPTNKFILRLLRHMKKIILPFCALLASTHSAFAEEDVTNIIINFTRSSAVVDERVAAVTIVNQVDILRSGASNISEVLRNQAGIQLSERTSGKGAIDMRGFGESASSNTLILVDGRRLNNADISGPSLNNISLNNIQRIEIIKGSAGSLYGDQAVGGVINVITKKIDDFSADIKLEAGSYERERITASINDRFADNFSFRLYGEAFKSDNYRDNNDEEVDHIFSRLAFDNKSTNIFVEYQRINEDQQLPATLWANEVADNPRQSIDDFKNDYSSVDEDVWRLGFDKKITSDFTVLVDYSERDQDTESVINFRGCIDSGSCTTNPNTQKRDTKAFSPKLIMRLPGNDGRFSLTVGADIKETDYEVTFNNRANLQEVNSIYIHGIVPLTQGYDVTLGSRYSEVKNTLRDDVTYPNGGITKDDSTVYNFGLSKKIDTVRLFARYDENFRFAKVDELAFSENNEPLKNQEGKSKELGIELKEEFFSIKALFYQIDLKNEIAYDPTTNSYSGSVFPGANVNFESTRRRGINIEITSKPHHLLDLSLAVTKMKSEFRTGVFKSSTISGVPETLSRFAIQSRFLNNWYAQFETNYIGRQYLSGDNANDKEKKSSYIISNLSSRIESGNWSFNARINNIFNKKYSQVDTLYGAINPASERNFLVTASYQF